MKEQNISYNLLVSSCSVLELVHGRISCQLLLNLASKYQTAHQKPEHRCKWQKNYTGKNLNRWSCIDLTKDQLQNEWGEAEIQLTNVADTGSSNVLGPSSSSGAPGTVISPSMSTFTAVGTKPGSDAILNFYFHMKRCWPNENSSAGVM